MFPRLVAGGASSEPMSRQQVTNAVINSLKMLEVDTKHFSGLSMRRGGISAGLVAGVPEPILFLQSGHGSNCAARNYMVPRNPHILFETYNAFGLCYGQGLQTRWQKSEGDGCGQGQERTILEGGKRKGRRKILAGGKG